MDILISTNTNFVHPTEVFLYSLCRSHENTRVDIYLAYHDLRREDISRLDRVLNLFHDKILHLIDVGGEFAKKVPAKGNLSVETYYRILALDLLPKQLHKILYLDADMIVKGNIEELFATDLTGYPLAACEDMNAHVGRVDVRTATGIPEESAYFNAGCLLFNLDYFREKELGSKIVTRIYNECNKYPYLDQDILNSEFYKNVKIIPWSLYNLQPILCMIDLYAIAYGKISLATYNDMNNRKEDFDRQYKDITDIIIERAKIIHYISDSKPWKHRDEEMYFVHAMYKHFWLDYETELNNCLASEGK